MQRNDLVDRVFVDLAVKSVVALGPEVRGAAFPIHKDRGIGNRFVEMSTRLDIDLKGSRKPLLDPSKSVVERGVRLRRIRSGSSLCPRGSNVGYVLLVNLLRGAEQQSRDKSENGKKEELRHIWPRAYVLKMRSNCAGFDSKQESWLTAKTSSFGERYVSTGRFRKRRVVFGVAGLRASKSVKEVSAVEKMVEVGCELVEGERNIGRVSTIHCGFARVSGLCSTWNFPFLRY